jgi:hypothetical protein
MAHHPVGPKINPCRGLDDVVKNNSLKISKRKDRKCQDEQRCAYNVPAQGLQMLEKRHFGLHAFAFFPDRADQLTSPIGHFFKIKYRCAAPANIYVLLYKNCLKILPQRTQSENRKALIVCFFFLCALCVSFAHFAVKN